MEESSGGESVAREKKPIFSFGLIADIQYADKDTVDGKRYREATGKLEKAVEAFNAQRENITCVLTLGDIIDGNTTLEQTTDDFQEVLMHLEKLKVPTFHLLGNHCLRLPRELVMKQLGMSARYYQKHICPGWALVVLDSMDMSLEWPAEADHYKEAMQFLKEHPLVSDQSNQMVEWNGGIGAEQKNWLVHVLEDAERKGTRLIVASHIPVFRGSAPDTHLMWNCDEIGSMLQGCPSVVLYLCGHFHKGGYQRQGKQHFVTLEAILEAPAETDAYGFVHVFADEIIIDGHGFVTSRVLPITASKDLEAV